jgi:hypothetical protein
LRFSVSLSGLKAIKRGRRRSRRASLKRFYKRVCGGTAKWRNSRGVCDIGGKAGRELLLVMTRLYWWMSKRKADERK